MHVFLIPSWYPTKEQPVTGCFLREQALALGRSGNKSRVSVSLHGASAYILNLKAPLVSVRRLLNFICASARRVETLAPHVVEIDRPVLEWSRVLADGNTRGVLNSHYANFIEAEAMTGRIDVIHAHVGFPAGWIAWKLSSRFNRPFVITEHMGPFPFPSPHLLKSDGTLTERLRAPYFASARNVAVSQALANAMAVHDIPRVAIIPNLVDEERFSPALSTSSTGDFVFFSLCGLVAEKGVDDLLKATALAIEEIPSLRLVVGGDGPMRGKLEALATQLGISSRVSWLGQVHPSVTPDLYRNCNAFILPSHGETFGVVYVEALACGKPVIATRCGGPESIVHEGNGLLVPIGDVQAIASAMVKLARNPQRYQSKEIRDDFMKRFSRVAVVQQLHAMYRSVIADQHLCTIHEGVENVRAAESMANSAKH